MNITGISGTNTQTLPLTLAVSAAVGATGTGTQVNLSSEFNLNGIYQDGTTYTTGGLDGTGYSYSANLLTGARVLNGILFNFGPANMLDAVGCSGQPVAVSQGQFSSLLFLATAVEGNQASQAIKVTYTDNTNFPVHSELQRLVHSSKLSGRVRGSGDGVPELRGRH